MLTVGTDASYPLASTQLHGKTVLELEHWLKMQGFSVMIGNPNVLHRPADAILDGAGNEAQSNGNKLSIYGSVLYAFMDAYAFELDGAQQGVIDALDQMSIATADAFWLDYWGNLFGIPRLHDPIVETDDAYRVRIIREVLRKRVNAFSIEQAIRDWTGFDVRIYEPWRDIFILDESALSDTAHIANNDYYTHNVIEPQGTPETDWAKVMLIIERNKAAGTIVLKPRVIPPIWNINAASSIAVGLTRKDQLTLGANRDKSARLSVNMVLDDYGFKYNTEFLAISQPVVTPGGLHIVRSAVFLGDYGWSGNWDYRTWMGRRAVGITSTRNAFYNRIDIASRLNARMIRTDFEVQRVDARGKLSVGIAAITQRNINSIIQSGAQMSVDMELDNYAIANAKEFIATSIPVVRPNDVHVLHGEAMPESTWSGNWDYRTWMGRRAVVVTALSTHS